MTEITQQREGGPAVLVVHSVLWGRMEVAVDKFFVASPKPYDPYDKAVGIVFKESHKKAKLITLVIPENDRFVTIEIEGRVVYDSRLDIPVDMEEFHKAERQFAADAASWSPISPREIAELFERRSREQHSNRTRTHL